jgi:hypothetical protein
MRMAISITKTLAMKGIVGPGVLAAAVISGGAAGAEPVFTPAATEACVNETYRTSPGLSGYAV